MRGSSAVFAWKSIVSIGIPALVITSIASTQAIGIPAFARKYGTSCLTCHTVYPKLNSFGEAFRRNGFRFPGVDSDFTKQETVPLGQEAYKKEFPEAVWPGILPASVPIAVGFNGQVVTHPDEKAGGAVADNGARVSMSDIIEEGHLWAGGSFDDKITFFGELTYTNAGEVELELANIRLNDLIGPKHALNLVIGKAFATTTSFGPHSTYISDMGVSTVPVTALYGGSTDSWNLNGQYGTVEANGTLQGRVGYAIGTNAGANFDVRNTENIYGHAEYKIGGMRLDGEDSSGVTNPKKPWAENSLSLGGFVYRSVSRFIASNGDTIRDPSTAYGGSVRVQIESLQLDGGLFGEKHDHATAEKGEVRVLGMYDELSYVVYPWLVPAARVEYLRLKQPGGDSIHDTRVLIGAAALIRANLKLTLVAQIESAKGAPDAGWEPAAGLASVPASEPGGKLGTVGSELEFINIGLAFAF